MKMALLGPIGRLIDPDTRKVQVFMTLPVEPDDGLTCQLDHSSSVDLKRRVDLAGHARVAGHINRTNEALRRALAGLPTNRRTVRKMAAAFGLQATFYGGGLAMVSDLAQGTRRLEQRTRRLKALLGE